MVWDEDLSVVRKERKDAVTKVMPDLCSSWLDHPPERPMKKECVAAGSIVASPTGGVTVGVCVKEWLSSPLRCNLWARAFLREFAAFRIPKYPIAFA